MNKKAIIAMSGGVDSSVAAYLMLNQGYECAGATMQLYDKPQCSAAGFPCMLHSFRYRRRQACGRTSGDALLCISHAGRIPQKCHTEIHGYLLCRWHPPTPASTATVF